MVYFLQLWQRIVSISSLPFKLDKWLFKLPKGWKISLNFTVKYTVDNAGQPPSAFSGDHYRYNDLDSSRKQIRLLKILPGTSGDVMATALLTVDLANAPPYETISYVWGPYNERPSLLIDGRPVEIHQTAFDAIHTLRRADSYRLVWVDAICINQSNNVEKGHQVTIMGEIYEKAGGVAVCLGNPTERTAEAMRVLRYFTEPRGSTGEPPWSHATLADTEETLADILTRPWFERIWTVQEATLARHTTLVCGDHEVSWSGDLRTMRSIVFRIKSAAISPYFSLSQHAYLSPINTRREMDWAPLLNILETQARQAARRQGVILQRNHLDVAFDFRHRQCTDPRDKYFAIFGIIENDQGAQLMVAPDYRMSLEELHRMFTAEVQRISEIEDVL